jgi:GT2 family glycosyltransferase
VLPSDPPPSGHDDSNGPASDGDPGVEVIVVAFGAPELLETCLDALAGQFPVVVVDNASDAEVRAITEGRGAVYVDPGVNLGFAAGVNRGLARRRSGGADVLLLNPDAIISPEGVRSLHRCLHGRSDLACVAPRQIEPISAAPSRVGWPFPTPVGAWVDAAGLSRLRRREDFMIGSVLLVRASALAQVGNFDEEFFLYAEETDWQRRAFDGGWRMVCCHEVTAAHIGAGTGGSADRRRVHFHASQERYIRKHHGRFGWEVYRTGTMAGAFIRAIVLPGQRGREAALRFHLYRRGPCQVESRT